MLPGVTKRGKKKRTDVEHGKAKSGLPGAKRGTFFAAAQVRVGSAAPEWPESFAER